MLGVPEAQARRSNNSRCTYCTWTVRRTIPAYFKERREIRELSPSVIHYSSTSNRVVSVRVVPIVIHSTDTNEYCGKQGT
mmetsp:Transcript_68181/g.76325  ORF Transcript_68181/g.76325 Transcript_68181/m.76325 type:complete len:80 (+) Transcript_68181:281-520(+)